MTFRAALVLLMAFVVWAYWPATRADFAIDDYVFIAQSRMIDAPWEAFWTNHFFEPVYFRPIGVTLWWFATQLFDAHYARHSVINLILHCINIALVGSLALRIVSKRFVAFVVATCFALAPFSLAAALWPSNRFDVLATLFCLLLTHAAMSYATHGRRASLLAVAVFTLFACWSKELAYPIVAAIAIVAAFSSAIEPRRRATIFIAIGIVCAAAFFWRHYVLPVPYVSVGHDSWRKWLDGATAWSAMSVKLADLTTGGKMLVVVAWWTLAVSLCAMLVLALARRNAALRFARDTTPTWLRFGGLAALAFVFAASVSVQLPLVSLFAPMLSSDTIGAVTFARFYYAPAAAFAIFVAVLLARAKFSTMIATLMLFAVVVIGVQQRSISKQYANWTNTELRPTARAATVIVDAMSEGSTSNDAPCVAVFLGTQTKHTWFRMFADVTVKSLTTKPDTTWRCHVMTESTPWIFISPASMQLADLGLPTIALDSANTPKPDYVWGGVRYRYRMNATELAKLPHARFFDWKSDRFVDVTDAVKSGAMAVKSKGWDL
jgi:hypothetical protein